MQEAQNETIRRDLINSIINIHSLMEEQMVWISNKLSTLPKEEQISSLVSQFDFVKSRINDILVQTYNLEEIIPQIGDATNPKENKIIASHATNEPSKHLTICNVLSRGFRDSVKGFVLRPAFVETFRYEESSN